MLYIVYSIIHYTYTIPSVPCTQDLLEKYTFKDADGNIVDAALQAGTIYMKYGDEFTLTTYDREKCCNHVCSKESNKFSLSFPTLLFLCSLVVVIAFLFPVLYPKSTCSGVKDYLNSDSFDSIKYFSEKEKKEIKNNIISKCLSGKWSDPLSIYIIVAPELRKESAEFVKKISSSFIIDTNTKYWRLDEQQLEEEIDTALLRNSQAIVVHDFIALPYRKAKLFFRYCDNENAPFKDKIFIFTSLSESCDRTSASSKVLQLMTDRWQSEVETESIEALATRVSGVSVCMF